MSNVPETIGDLLPEDLTQIQASSPQLQAQHREEQLQILRNRVLGLADLREGGIEPDIFLRIQTPGNETIEVLTRDLDEWQRVREVAIATQEQRIAQLQALRARLPRLERLRDNGFMEPEIFRRIRVALPNENVEELTRELDEWQRVREVAIATQEQRIAQLQALRARLPGLERLRDNDFMGPEIFWRIRGALPNENVEELTRELDEWQRVREGAIATQERRIAQLQALRARLPGLERLRDNGFMEPEIFRRIRFALPNENVEELTRELDEWQRMREAAADRAVVEQVLGRAGNEQNVNGFDKTAGLAMMKLVQRYVRNGLYHDIMVENGTYDNFNFSQELRMQILQRLRAKIENYYNGQATDPIVFINEHPNFKLKAGNVGMEPGELRLFQRDVMLRLVDRMINDGVRDSLVNAHGMGGHYQAAENLTVPTIYALSWLAVNDDEIIVPNPGQTQQDREKAVFAQIYESARAYNMEGHNRYNVIEDHNSCSHGMMIRGIYATHGIVRTDLVNILDERAVYTYIGDVMQRDLAVQTADRLRADRVADAEWLQNFNGAIADLQATENPLLLTPARRQAYDVYLDDIFRQLDARFHLNSPDESPLSQDNITRFRREYMGQLYWSLEP